MQATKQKLENIGRLKKRSDFLYVQRAGKKWVSGTLIIQAAPFETDLALYGVTATKKLGNAVTRNRIKRRLRSAADDIIGEFAKKGMAYVLIGRAETELAPADKLRNDLKWCLKKLDCLRDDDTKS